MRCSSTIIGFLLAFGPSGCASPPPPAPEEQGAGAPALLRLFELPQLLPPASWSGSPPLRFGQAPGPFGVRAVAEERVGMTVRRLRPLGEATALPAEVRGLGEAAPPSRTTAARAAWRLRLPQPPDALWFERRSSVNPFPLLQEPGVGRLLSDGPRQAGRRGGFTGLVSSEEGSAVLAAYRLDF